MWGKDGGEKYDDDDETQGVNTQSINLHRGEDSGFRLVVMIISCKRKYRIRRSTRLSPKAGRNGDGGQENGVTGGRDGGLQAEITSRCQIRVPWSCRGTAGPREAMQGNAWSAITAEGSGSE